MSAARVYVTRSGCVRYGTESSFEYLGRIERRASSTSRPLWSSTIDGVETVGTHDTKAEAVSRIVRAARLDRATS